MMSALAVWGLLDAELGVGVRKSRSKMLLCCGCCCGWPAGEVAVAVGPGVATAAVVAGGPPLKAAEADVAVERAGAVAVAGVEAGAPNEGGSSPKRSSMGAGAGAGGVGLG